ncbi:hypothetical protein CWB99_23410 [Pseudoalteromonas rubra]|uniref:Uncharacterized protein n=1 Tax=Pseudoalteromonas rubra TaxID=43658 RepID=A0A5S3WEQ6_9GAMM|nr:hypothetical protein [Pseudoalteromonas rubra]TMP23331.1 hypothetical protein CWB99_23410 [Pseudoalteromonas rubra]TMP27157.1 hypothetical protein CWC00_23540 [Pseudoalteromonas rubra]
MKFKGLFLAISTAITLSACGGSSGDKTVVGNEQQTKANASKPDPDKPTPVFSVAATLINDCSAVPNPTVADVIFHNASGQVIASNKTGADGKLAQALPENTHHVSLVAKSVGGQTLKTQLYTLLDVTNTDYGIIEFDQKPSCDCPRKSLDLSALSASQPDYYISGFIGDDVPLRAPTPDSAYFCDESKNAILHISNEDYSDVRGGLFNLEGDGPLELTDGDFASPGVRVNIAALPFSKAEYPESRIFLSSFDDNEQLSSHIILGANPRNKYIFPDLATTSYAYNAITEHAVLPGFNMYTSSATVNTIADDGQPAGTTPLLFNSAFQNAFEQFAQSMADQNSGNLFDYDFSGVDPRVNMVAITLLWEDTVNGKVRWEVMSEPQATIPDFEFGTSVNTNITSVEGIEINLDVAALNFSGEFDALRREFQKGDAGNVYTDTSLLKGAAVYSFEIEISE